jgi:Family of unknown function (DUF6029)
MMTPFTKKMLAMFVILWLANYPLIAQETNKKKWYQNFTGSIESNTQFYEKDTLINSVVPAGGIGSHNFVTLKYNYGNFTVGTQLEAYLPSLQGYTFQLNGAKFTNNFISYKKKEYEIIVGDFYKQFGNGSLLRAYENRAIGINNAIKGVSLFVKPLKNMSINALYGKQRINFGKSEGVILAGDIDYQILGNKEGSTQTLSLAASIVNRQQPYTGILTNVPESTTGYELRSKYATDQFSIEGTYTHKGYDPSDANQGIINEGNSVYLNTSYSTTGLSVQLQLRRMENIDFRTDRKALATYLPINFNAPLTKPSDFNLVNIYVYPPQFLGEMASQFDATYTFAEGTKMGGEYGSTLSFNASTANNLAITGRTYNSFEAKLLGLGEKYFSSINIDFNKKFSKTYTGYFSYHNIYYNTNLQSGSSYFEPIVANILVHQGRYKLKKGKSLRYEIQHLFTEQDKKNWLSAQVEYSLIPYFTFFAGDMYNYGNIDKIHYYNIGSSFTYKNNRIILNYGRQREGLVCVGGVCRNVPASTGLNISVQGSF